MSDTPTFVKLKAKRRALFDAYAAARANLDFAILDHAEEDEVKPFRDALYDASKALTEFTKQHPETSNHI